MTARDPADLADEYQAASRFQSFAFYSTRTHLASEPRFQVTSDTEPLTIEGPARRPIPPDPSIATMALSEVITTRRSAVAFRPDSLPADRLGTLLYLGNGIRPETPSEKAGLPRNAPSAGNLGSVEVFPILLDVNGVESGIYHYDSRHHDLVILKSGDFRKWLAATVLIQREYAAAGAALVLTCDLARLRGKYGVRGLRLGLLDVGHVSENLYLAATSLGLGVRATAGFLESEVDRALGLDGRTRASCLIVLIGTAEIR